MKSLLSFPKAQRLRAYLTAAELLLDGQETYSCIALARAFDPRGFAFYLNVAGGVEHDVWVRLFGHSNLTTVVSVDPRFDRLQELKRINSMHRTPQESAELEALHGSVVEDARQTRLLMLALLHALDEVGDLRRILP